MSVNFIKAAIGIVGIVAASVLLGLGRLSETAGTGLITYCLGYTIGNAENAVTTTRPIAERKAEKS